MDLRNLGENYGLASTDALRRLVGNLGGTNTSAANGGIPGLGTDDSFGTYSSATFDPRQIEFQLRNPVLSARWRSG